MVIFLLFCYACVTSGKGNVTFTSRNFRNILRWDAASPRVPGEIVRYSVFYCEIDDALFHEKDECQNITVQFCDLTRVTPADHDAHYRAKVLTHDGSLHGISLKFKPIAETVLGAPTLSYDPNRTPLRMDVELPVGPNNESIKDIFTRNHKGPAEATTHYILVITEPLWAAEKNTNTIGHFDVNLKNNGTKYCGYVVYTPLHEYGRPVSEKALFCTTPILQDHSWMVLPWLLLSAVVVVAVVLMALCFAKCYVKDVKKDKLPPSLNSTKHPPQLILSPQKDPYIYKPDMSNVESEETGYAKIRFPPNVLSTADGGYGHKNTIFVPWNEDSSLETEGHHIPIPRELPDSGQSSEIYGAVAVNVVNAEENDNHQRQPNQTGRNNTLLVESGQLLSSVDISDNKEAQPLFLQTRKNSEGKLMLSFQVPQTFTGTTTEELVPCEKKPLLSLSYLIVSSDKESNFVSLHSLESLECSDSGLDENTLPTPTQDCDLASQYLPSQLDLTNFSPSSQSPLPCDSSSHNSAYQPNWIPSVNHETHKTSYPWTWSGLKEECKEDG